MNNAKRFVLLALSLLLCAGLLTAQQTNAKIFGVVQLEDGSLVPGVSIEATSPKLVGKTTAVTDENGGFRLLNLAPGAYKLVFSLQGFQTVVRENVQLALEQTLNLKITMKLGNIEEMVTITGQVAQIDVKSTAKGMTLTREVFQTLPRGRNFDSLVSAVPGVSSEPLMLGGTSVDGASGLENMYYVDGADTTNIKDGSSGQSVSFDFVDEVQVKASGYAAEFGGSLGGVINVVTRSGGNEFHGEVVGYYSGSALEATKRDILDLDFNDDSKAQYIPYETYYGVNDAHRFEGGFNLGGYILKDKLWFFGTVMPIYYTNTRTTTYLSGAVRDWKRTENTMNYQIKLTAQPVKNLRLGASFVNNFYKYKGDLSNAFGNPDPNTSYNDYGFSYPNMSGNFSADLTMGNNFMFSARAGYFKTNQNKQLVAPTEPCFQFITEAPGGYFKTTNIGLLDVPAAYQRASGFYNYSRGNSSVVKKSINEKLSVSGDLSYFVNLAGEHSWKAGFSWVRRGQDVDNTAFGPVLFFGWDRDMVAYGVNYGRGKYGYYGVRNNDVTGPYGDFYNAFGNMYAFYVQDSWTIANRFTVNFGVRAESEVIPSYATGNPDFENLDAIKFGFGDKLAPRLGFVWDVKGDSSLKVFGSFGMFYDVMKLEMASGSYGGTKWKSAYYSLDTYEWDKIGVNGYFPGRQLLGDGNTFDFRAPSFDSTDPDMKPMTQREISFGLEKRLADNLSLSARFVNKHLLWAIEDCGILLPEGEMYYTTNPGSDFLKEKYAVARAEGLIPQNAPDCTKALRDYYAVNIALDKRFSDNWLGGISYTFSSLKGNYSGLASGDEVSMTAGARTDPNVARYFDNWYVSLTRDLKPSKGPLPGDRPHYFKAYGSYSFPFGMTAGLVLNAMSGTPTSTEWAMDYQGYFPLGRGNEKRAPFLWFANLYAEYNLKLGKNNLNINVNVDNVFNVKTAQRLYGIYNQGAVAISDERIAQGSWNIDDYDPVLDPRYLMKANFYAPLTARLGLKFSF
ncbi:MAG: carboxypeptidase regulatory-like domain-containing protein [Acidobacteriota bacterium]|nr:carboxypeptidase regulatory-like domain-containing protein [Acidobacteriota bacterium]